jgi:hypothetical protein
MMRVIPLTESDLKRILTINDKCVILTDDNLAMIPGAIDMLNSIPEKRDIMLACGIMGMLWDQPDVGNIARDKIIPLLKKYGNHIIRFSVSVERWNVDEPEMLDAIDAPPPVITDPCEQCGRQAVYLVQPVGAADVDFHLCVHCSNSWVGEAVIGPLDAHDDRREVPRG